MLALLFGQLAIRGASRAFPITPDSGVRSSWPTVATNTDLAFDASTAASRASALRLASSASFARLLAYEAQRSLATGPEAEHEEGEHEARARPTQEDRERVRVREQRGYRWPVRKP